MFTLLLLLNLAKAVTVERLDPRLDKIVGVEVSADVIAQNLTWTEGPLFLPDGRLLFADIKTNSVRELSPKGQVRVLLSPSGYLGHQPYPGPEPGSSAMALDSRGRVVTAGHAGRSVWRFDRVGGPRAGHVERTILVTHFEGRRLNSPNDLVVAKDGAIYFTDPPFGLPTQKLGDPLQQQRGSAVYRLSDPGTKTQRIERVTDAVAGPNGLAFSPDQKTLYVADTPKKRWLKFAVNKDGSLGPAVTFAEVGLDARPGEPDGLKVDADGNVFAAGPGGVWIFAPDGTHLGTIPLNHKSSNLAWGADSHTLFVTAGEVIYRVGLSVGGTADSPAASP